MLIDSVKRALKVCQWKIASGEKMQRPAVSKWDRVIHKSVRTEDGNPVGYIAAEGEGSIIVLSSGFRQYTIPKSNVKEFDGSQVYLDFPTSELNRYRVQ